MRVDLSNLERMLNGDRECLQKVLKMIVDKAPSSMERLKSNLESLNYPGLKSAAHSLKPQMSYLGNSHMLDLVSNIEKHSIERTDYNILKIEVENFENEYQSVIFELRKHIQNL